MAQVVNSETVKEIIKAGGLQTNQGIPTVLSNVIMPTIEANPRLLRHTNVRYYNTCINGTSTTILTTPTDKDFFVTYVWLAMSRDASATSTSSTVTATINGTSDPIAVIATVTLTAGIQVTSQAFPQPIKIDRGTTITVTNQSGTAAITSRAIVAGYYEEYKGE